MFVFFDAIARQFSRKVWCFSYFTCGYGHEIHGVFFRRPCVVSDPTGKSDEESPILNPSFFKRNILVGEYTQTLNKPSGK